MRKVVITILFVLFATTSVVAQYNRDYFFYIGRRQMMDNDFKEAIRRVISCEELPNTTLTICSVPRLTLRRQ